MAGRQGRRGPLGATSGRCSARQRRPQAALEAPPPHTLLNKVTRLGERDASRTAPASALSRAAVAPLRSLAARPRPSASQERRLAPLLLDTRRKWTLLERLNSIRTSAGDRGAQRRRRPSWVAVTMVWIPPRTLKSPTTVMRRGLVAFTRSSRMRLVTASWKWPAFRNAQR